MSWPIWPSSMSRFAVTWLGTQRKGQLIASILPVFATAAIALLFAKLGLEPTGGTPADLAARFSHPDIGPQRVIKGGSWLCAPQFCLRYRPAARQAQETGLGTNHVGFRVAFDAASPE